MVRLLAPFSAALLWAAVLALALHPIYRKGLKFLRDQAGIAASILTLAVLLLIVGPTVALLTTLVSQAIGLYHGAAQDIQSGVIIEFGNRIESFFTRYLSSLPFLTDLNIREVLLSGFGRLSSFLASQIGNVLKNTAILAVDLSIMLVAFYFFIKNGERYYRAGMDLLPFTAKRKQAMSLKFHNTFTAVINGVFLIALGQGFMTGVGFALFRVPFPAFWGSLAALLALLPIGGAALVWLPGAAYLMLSGSIVHGVFLALWGLVLVSLPDNFLKPLLIGRKAKLSAFVLFLSILGGLKLYGILGILIGPLIVTLLTAFIEFYQEEYAEQEI
jgi:predicted PurR-regulated permease PerM